MSTGISANIPDAPDPRGIFAAGRWRCSTTPTCLMPFMPSRMAGGVMIDIPDLLNQLGVDVFAAPNNRS